MISCIMRKHEELSSSWHQIVVAVHIADISAYNIKYIRHK